MRPVGFLSTTQVDIMKDSSLEEDAYLGAALKSSFRCTYSGQRNVPGLR